MALPSMQSRVPIEHSGVCCDNCGQDPIRGHRYKCINCPDFDLCHGCEELLVHREDHIFLKIRSPTPNSNLHFVPIASQDTKAVEQLMPSQEVVDMINQFGFQLQWTWGVTTQSASAISAFNIYNCLIMVAAGSKDQSLEAFQKTLFGGQVKIHPLILRAVQLGDYCKAGASGAIELASASSVWYSPTFSIGANWSNTMQTIFKAKFAPINARNINQWVSDQTKGRITSVVSERGPPQSDLVLVTCLYFKAQWLEPFSETRTNGSTFYGSNLRQFPCQMMNRCGYMSYGEDDQLQVCILPYRDGPPQAKFHPKWHAAIILPKSGPPPASELLYLSNLISRFSKSPAELRSLLKPNGALLPQKYINLSIPRFERRQTLDVIDQLTEMGLSPVFEMSDDLRPIITSDPAAINKVQHDIFIEVNEHGTEMAAATAIGMFGGSAAPPQPTEMRVDRPFLFLIFDAETTLVLCSAIIDSI